VAPRSPWHIGSAERVIGSIRRECLAHVIILSEMHLRRVMKAYVEYYNRSRTHLALRKDSPFLNGLSTMALFCPSHSWRTASSILQNLILRGTTIYHFIECRRLPGHPADCYRPLRSRGHLGNIGWRNHRGCKPGRDSVWRLGWR